MINSLKRHSGIIGFGIIFLWVCLPFVVESVTATISGQGEVAADTHATPNLIEQAWHSGDLDRETANLYLAYALFKPDALPLQFQSQVPWHGTLVLHHLQQTVTEMKHSPQQTIINRLLKGACSSSSANLPNTFDSTHFHIQYNTIGGGLTITDYVTSLEIAWAVEVDQFGWAAPPVHPHNPPPGDRYHVRIDTSLNSNLYGYVASSGTHAGFVGNNPNTTWDEGDAYATCMVLNHNYTDFPGSPQHALNATTAHEFNHSLQFGYGALNTNAPDGSFIEGGATWMEDEVFDAANDNYNYLWPDFNLCMGEYRPQPYFPYPYWITLRGLTEPYGVGTLNAGEQIMQDFWEAVSQNTSQNQLTALNDALVKQGTTLADAFHQYAITVKFNKSCETTTAYPYCFKEGGNYVAAAGETSAHGALNTVGETYQGRIPNHYALNWITLPANQGDYYLSLKNTATGGILRGSVACDTGSALQVMPLPNTLATGEIGYIEVESANCNQVVAVITNQEQTSPNPSYCPSHSYELKTAQASTWTGQTNNNWHTTSNWLPTSLPTSRTHVLIPPAPHQPVITEEDVVVDDLTIEAGASLNITTRTLAIEGNLTNQGWLTQTIFVPSNSKTDFLSLQNVAHTQTKYIGVILTTTTTASGSIGTTINPVTVAIGGQQFCQGHQTGIKRCFEIINNSTLKGTIRFYFDNLEENNQPLSQLVAYRQTNQGWLIEEGPYRWGNDAQGGYIEVNNIPQTGRFALALPPPKLGLTPLTFSTTLTSYTPISRALTISNTGQGPLSWTLFEVPPALWLSQNVVSNTLAASQTESVRLTFNPLGLEAGLYTTTLDLNSNDPDLAHIHIPVSITLDLAENQLVRRIYMPLIHK